MPHLIYRGKEKKQEKKSKLKPLKREEKRWIKISSTKRERGRGRESERGSV